MEVGKGFAKTEKEEQPRRIAFLYLGLEMGMQCFALLLHNPIEKSMYVHGFGSDAETIHEICKLRKIKRIVIGEGFEFET